MKKFLSSVICAIMLLTSVTALAENREMNESASTATWASVVKSYLYDNKNGTFTVINADDNECLVSVYDSGFSQVSSKKVERELEKFGGFYAGEKYNYIVFGQDNMEENDSKEVLRIVKYDKDFNRISAASVSDCYTTLPFYAGTLRMAEADGKLAVHTSRQRYLTDDGLRHQSQLTVFLNTEDMTIVNRDDLGSFQDNHVSHSFNQFAIHDGERFVFADHGDAYPRSVVIHKHNGSDYRKGSYFEPQYTEVNMFEIPGDVGANMTGVVLGGFESSDSSYLAAINTVDHSKVTGYTSVGLQGLEYDERDIVLLVCDKDGKEDDVKQVKLADYSDTKKLGSRPYLVKLSADRFLVMWEELEYTFFMYFPESSGVKYVQVNGRGEIVSDVRFDKNLRLSADCQPTVVGNRLLWYVLNGESVNLQSLDLNEALITVVLNGKYVSFEQPPVILNERTLVPLRAIFEAMNAGVDWNGKTQTVTASRGSTKISLAINSNILYKNGSPVMLDVPAQLVNDRTMVPARAVAEAFGANVSWDGETKSVVITE